jgi:type II secretory pathway pseudopilin PulG
VTLAEVLVSASLFVVVLSLVGAGMGQMVRSAGRAEALGVAQESLRLAWQRLQGDIRYATAIGVPVQVASDASNWHVVFATPSACVELRLDAAATNLDRRDLTAGTDWVTIGPGVTASAGVAPFTLVPATASGHQGLDVNLTMTSGGSRDSSVRSRTMQFSAANSTVSSTLPSDCVVTA